MKILQWLCNLGRKKERSGLSEKRSAPPPYKAIHIREVSDYLKLVGFRVDITFSASDNIISDETVTGIVKDLSDNCQHLILTNAERRFQETPPVVQPIMSIPLSRIKFIEVVNRFMGMKPEEYSTVTSSLSAHKVKPEQVPISVIPLREKAMNTVKIAGVNVRVPITSIIEEFFEIANNHRTCVMLIKTKDYSQTKQKVFEYFSHRFPRDFSYQKAATSAKLVCRGCKTEFPYSYLLSLEKELGPNLIVGGATAGFDEFGQSGKCPKCNCQESFYVYDNLLGEDITQNDVDALCEYWRYLAKQWWQTTSRTEGWCDGCTRPLCSGDGYQIGSRIYCEKCAFKPDPYESLRKDPNFFGVGAVRKARHFVSGGGPLIIETPTKDNV